MQLKMNFPPTERGNMSEFKRKAQAVKGGRTPKKVNIVTINESFQAIYEINNKSWVLQELEAEKWQDLAFLGSFINCVKYMVDYKAATTCTTLDELLQYYQEARKNIDFLLSLEGVVINFEGEPILRHGIK